MATAGRKLALTAHVACSVGWLGAVAAFLALAVAGRWGSDPEAMRAMYVAMLPTTWWLVVPLCFASLVTGVVASLVSPWGLWRHYWVLVKLGLSLVATALLLLHTRPIGIVAEAARGSLGVGDLLPLRTQLVFDAGAALVVLLANTALSVYKPRGLTRYGWRKQQAQAALR
jgi:hypothetical protein